MARFARLIAIGAAASIAAACSDGSGINGTSLSSSALDPAFVSTPAGFEATTSSFDGSANTTNDDRDEFRPEVRQEHHDRGPNGLMGGFDFMGGGLMDDYRGGPLGGGRPFDRDDFRDSCSFDSATGTVTCAPETRRGLTVTRSIVFKTAAGVAQARPDSTTNSVATHTTVTGTRTRRDSTVTTVNHVSDRTVVGLAKGSTQRTVNGTSAGTESTTGRDSVGAYTALRTIGDTVSGIVVPVASGRPSYPTAGSVTRSMSVTLTYSGQAPVTSTRREVLTFDGSATAQLVITKDGTSKTCTVPLPHGRPVCP